MENKVHSEESENNIPALRPQDIEWLNQFGEGTLEEYEALRADPAFKNVEPVKILVHILKKRESTYTRKFSAHEMRELKFAADISGPDMRTICVAMYNMPKYANEKPIEKLMNIAFPPMSQKEIDDDYRYMHTSLNSASDQSAHEMQQNVRSAVSAVIA